MSMVSQRIRAARGMLGLSRYQAARTLGLAERRVRQNESGEVPILAGDLMAYGQLYGVSEAWLRGGPAAALQAAMTGHERRSPESTRRSEVACTTWTP
jgi:transcriptional regulator with XRE-family HTH domain